MRSIFRCLAALLLPALLVLSCTPPTVDLEAPAVLEPGTRLVQTLETRTEGLRVTLTLPGQVFPGEMEIHMRARLEVDVVSDRERRVVVREDLARVGLRLDNETLPSQEQHGALEGIPLVASRGEDGWVVRLASGQPSAAQAAELRRLSSRFVDGSTSYTGTALQPGDESELDSLALKAALGELISDLTGSGTVRVEGVETRDGIRGADLTVTAYYSGSLEIPGLDWSTMEVTLQGDVFRSLEHNVDLDYTLAGDFALEGAMHDARGSARLEGEGRLTVTGHVELELP